MKNLNKIVEDLSTGLLNEMAMAQLQDKDVLKKMSQKDYSGAVDLYLQKGGAIGASASPKRTITALRGKVIAQDPRFKDINLEIIDDFEKELLKRHEEAKKVSKETGEQAKAESEVKTSETQQEAPKKEKKVVRAEPEEEPSSDKELGKYLSSFPEDIRKKFEKKLVKDFELGYLVPKDFRADEEWIANSFKMFDLDTKEGRKLNRFAQAVASREARQKTRRKVAKSSLEKQTKQEYDEYGYPIEEKFRKEKDIADYIKKASLIEIKPYDSEEEKKEKEQKLFKLAQDILAARKVFIFKTDDGVVSKMPDKTDELYPLARAVYDYKKGSGSPDFKKLMLGIKRIGTHAPSTIREKTKKRIDDEINVAFSEIDDINTKTTLDELKDIAKDILKLLGYTAKQKPVRKEFIEYPEYFDAINFLWMVNFGVLKDVKDVEAEKVRNYLKFIKKEGIKNLVDLKWAGEPNIGDAVMGKEKQAQELSAKLKEDFSIKNKILKEALGISINREEIFFENLAKGFVNDFSIFKEDTASFYTDVFGEEFSIIFEEFQNNIEVLEEEIKINSPFVKKLPGAPALGPDALSSAKNLQTLNKIADEAVPSRTGILGTIWKGIKTFGAKMAIRYPALADTLKKGLGWITANPGAVLGIAGGALLLKSIIKALKKRGENKVAAKLQTAIDSKGSKQ